LTTYFLSKEIIKVLRKPLLLATIIIVFLSLLPTVVLADAGPQPPIDPDLPLDCGVWAELPKKSGANVEGKGEVSCATNHSSLRVVAGLRDWTGRYTSKTKTCYGTNYCNVTATLSYFSGRQWQTDVSGYVSDISWQAYYATNWISIP
jgi:hypothetical protein